MTAAVYAKAADRRSWLAADAMHEARLCYDAGMWESGDHCAREARIHLRRAIALALASNRRNRSLFSTSGDAAQVGPR